MLYKYKTDNFNYLFYLLVVKKGKIYMDKKAEETKAMLKKYGQEHLLNYYEKMDDVHKETLLKQSMLNFILRNLWMLMLLEKLN